MVTITDAAIRFNGTTYTGRRHAHILRNMVELGIMDMQNKLTLDMQGFMTSDNIFVDRETAKVIALQAGQIPESFTCTLHSEDLW